MKLKVGTLRRLIREEVGRLLEGVDFESLASDVGSSPEELQDLFRKAAHQKTQWSQTRAFIKGMGIDPNSPEGKELEGKLTGAMKGYRHPGEHKPVPLSDEERRAEMEKFYGRGEMVGTRGRVTGD